ncbi:glycosyltransferase family 2 protein [Parabacteroides sp. FAFU027]|uniref:glycosyltransferase family 2 protein n=1 Tax=Parabacteroides sp. FAFU027 TaxID=2922715 RepID=UPI001FB009C8|nr:glycosyltransferase family 2 protein [Parabacteroides sp. FAFU027]
MNNSPLVSVLMTVYNREKYIAEAIDSVIASSYQNWELIIVDDQSKDQSVEIAKKYTEIDSRIRLYVNEKNLGDYPNRNKAASFAKGKYLKYLDADDTIYKYSLDYMVEAMETFPDAALGISFNKIDDNKPYPQLSMPKETIRNEFLGKSILGCGPSAAILRRDVFKELGGFSGKQYIGDHELWLKIAGKYPIVKLQPSLIWWRVHLDQQIRLESKDITVQNIRYQLALNALNSNHSFLHEKEFSNADLRLKQNYSRRLLRILLGERRILDFYKLLKLSNLSLIELLSGFKHYIK